MPADAICLTRPPLATNTTRKKMPPESQKIFQQSVNCPP
jgi:hypothetical protein